MQQHLLKKIKIIMRKLIIIFTFLFAIKGKSLGSEIWKISIQNSSLDTLPTAQLIPFLQQMNVQSFYGLPVDSFLAAVPANLYNMKVYSSDNSKYPLFRASYLRVDFTSSHNGPGAIIYVQNFTHMNKYSSTGSWDVSLFRLENIHKIELWANQNNCINGACLQ